MSVKSVIENIKNIEDGSAGCSLRIKIAAYNLLEFIISNNNYDNLINAIYKYYDEEFDYEISSTTAQDDLQYLLLLCCTLMLNGENYSLEDAGLESKNYTDKDINKFLLFVNLINEKYDYELKLDVINSLQIQRNLLSQEKFEKTINSTEEKIKQMDEKIEKIHFDIISIISIFTAIIFTLYGGTQLVSSVVNKISKHNYHLIINTGIIMGYVLIMLASVLMTAISSRCKNSFKVWCLLTLNLLYSIVVIVTLCSGC